jgi:hypothetical protein
MSNFFRTVPERRLISNDSEFTITIIYAITGVVSFTSTVYALHTQDHSCTCTILLSLRYHINAVYSRKVNVVYVGERNDLLMYE